MAFIGKGWFALLLVFHTAITKAIGGRRPSSSVQVRFCEPGAPRPVFFLSPSGICAPGQLLLSPLTLAAQTTAQAALSSALRSTPAVGLVVDVKSGRQLAAVKAIGERHAPGSILKPLFLAAALEQREVLPETTVFCRRNLHISYGTQEWNLACTHPAE